MTPALLVFLLYIVNFVQCEWPTRVPFFPLYPTRTVQVLDGQWNFGYKPNFNVFSTISPEMMKTLTPNSTTVPSCFDVALPGIEGPRGTAFYRTTYKATPGRTQLIYISACSFYCRIFVDGKFIIDHRASGYTPFSVTVPASQSTERELFILADNRFNKTTAPTHTGGDFYNYGGLTRNVLVHELPAASSFLERIEVLPKSQSKMTVDINIILGTSVSTNSAIRLIWDNNNSSASDHTVSVQNGVGVLKDISVPNANLWSLKSPNLHEVEVQWLSSSKTVIDSILVRFGMRFLGVDKTSSRLTLNGEVVKLHGFNRHTMYPDTGSALTYDQVKEDVKFLKDIGANYVRGAHYPQDQRFLDLCDENGIVVWEETLGPGVKTSDLEDPYFMKYQVQAMNEMISQSINNPSVIFWAFYNEGPSNDKKACPGYNVSASVARSRDPTRYITWANNKELSDVCIEKIADVASFNHYPGWYDHPGDKTDPARHWNSMADGAYQKWPGKPFTISETGAGGIYEWTNKTDCKWSQLYQSEIVGADAKVALSNDKISGITLWQFSDIKANSKATAECGQCDYIPHTHNCSYINSKCGRPGGENHKGSLDFWRRKKQAYDTVKSLYKKVW